MHGYAIFVMALSVIFIIAQLSFQIGVYVLLNNESIDAEAINVALNISAGDPNATLPSLRAEDFLCKNEPKFL